jgi:SAM-dependent methyltransferase
MCQLKEYASESPDVSKAVRGFYNQHPYPQPVDDLEKYKNFSQDKLKSRANYHLYWPASAYRDDYSILIAGCGTSQAAKHAMRWPSARVTGIDVSGASVRHTEDLKRKYKLNNLDVHELPIERVNELGNKFDQIVCTGVLHHLADPDAGLRVLRGMLKPHGAMHLMVYAPYGRAGIYMLQEFCKRVGVPATSEGIRDLVIALKLLPAEHPLLPLLRESPDFLDEAALADAFLHPQDRAYSVPQLFDFLKTGGMTFGRWLRQAAYDPHCGVIAQIPQFSQMMELSPVEQYAAVELFRGTMVHHSFVAYRNDNPVAQAISFSGDAWFGFVPLRLPDTICVQKASSDHDSSALINRSHSYRDLVMPIDQIEKRWFDAIDGNCCIGDILKKTTQPAHQSSHTEMARAFFERLWRYDQISLDGSFGLH